MAYKRVDIKSPTGSGFTNRLACEKMGQKFVSLVTYLRTYVNFGANVPYAASKKKRMKNEFQSVIESPA